MTKRSYPFKFNFIFTSLMSITFYIHLNGINVQITITSTSNIKFQSKIQLCLSNATKPQMKFLAIKNTGFITSNTRKRHMRKIYYWYKIYSTCLSRCYLELCTWADRLLSTITRRNINCNQRTNSAVIHDEIREQSYATIVHGAMKSYTY